MGPEERDAVLDLVRRPAPAPGDLEARVAVLEAREAVADVVARYALLCDVRAWAEVAELFTDDAVRVLRGSLDQVVEGRAALLEAWERPVLPTRPGEGADVVLVESPVLSDPDRVASRHLMATDVTWVDPDAGRAEAVVQYALVMTRDGGPGAFEHGQHEGLARFALVRQGGTWRISRLTITADTAHNPLLRPPAPAGGGS